MFTFLVRIIWILHITYKIMCSWVIFPRCSVQWILQVFYQNLCHIKRMCYFQRLNNINERCPYHSFPSIILCTTTFVITHKRWRKPRQPFFLVVFQILLYVYKLLLCCLHVSLGCHKKQNYCCLCWNKYFIFFRTGVQYI